MRPSRLKREQERAKPPAPKRAAPAGRLTIEAIKERVQIEDVLEELGTHVPPRSGWTKVSCPFHEDRTPSASVQPTEGYFQCFSCEVRGDIVDLAQEHLSTTDVREALDWLDRTF